jgi:serine/threonine protein kinase
VRSGECVSSAARIGRDPFAGTLYRARDVLGRGRFSTAYIVEQVETGRRFVAKLLIRSLADGGPTYNNSRVAARMRVDADALRELAQLRHPNIVRFVEFSRTIDGRPFIVTELLEGELLDEAFERRSFSAGEAARLVCQLCSALGAAHGLKLVHRDIHLRNLFLQECPGRRPSLVVLDFGLAKVLAGSPVQPLEVPTEEDVLVGAPRAIAPEAVRSEPLDHRADVYAAGLVLLSLLTGQRAFADLLATREIYLAHVWRELPRPSSVRDDVPADLDDVVARAVAKYPRDRFQTAESFARALKGIHLPELSPPREQLK